MAKKLSMLKYLKGVETVPCDSSGFILVQPVEAVKGSQESYLRSWKFGWESTQKRGIC